MNKVEHMSKNSWKAEVEKLKFREKLVTEMGGEENVKRQHDAGRMTVRTKRCFGPGRTWVEC